MAALRLHLVLMLIGVGAGLYFAYASEGNSLVAPLNAGKLAAWRSSVLRDEEARIKRLNDDFGASAERDQSLVEVRRETRRQRLLLGPAPLSRRLAWIAVGVVMFSSAFGAWTLVRRQMRFMYGSRLAHIARALAFAALPLVLLSVIGGAAAGIGAATYWPVSPVRPDYNPRTVIDVSGLGVSWGHLGLTLSAVAGIVAAIVAGLLPARTGTQATARHSSVAAVTIDAAGVCAGAFLLALSLPAIDRVVFELAFPALSAALAACVVALVLVRLFAGKADIALARRGQLALAGTAGMGEWGRAPAIQDVMGDHSVRGLGVSLIMQRISTAAALSCIAIVVFGFKVSDLGGARIIALAGFASVAALALGRATIALPALMLWIAPRFGIDMEHAWLLADLSLVAIPFATLCDGYLSLTLASALNRRADDVLLTEEIFDDADIVEELPEDLEMNRTPIAKTKEPVSRDTGSSSTQ